MLFLRLAPVHQVSPETPGRHITNQAALWHQVEGLGGHPQGRHQHQRHGLLLALDGHEAAIDQFDLRFIGQAVVTHRHQVAIQHQLKPGAPGLDQGVALEQPVDAIGGGARQALVQRQAVAQRHFRQFVHAACSPSWTIFSRSSNAWPR